MPRNRRIRLTIALAVVGVVGLIAAGSALALRAEVRVTISSSGFSPRVLRIDAADIIPVWSNTDSVAHTVTFADGCSVKIEPGGEAQAPCDSYSQCAGAKSFSVDGFEGTAGQLMIVPESRAVTLHASSRSVKRGRMVSLSGELSYANPSPPSPAPRQQVVIRRMVGSGGFRVVARVMSTGGWESTWHAQLRPSATAVYQVEVSAQLRKGCTLWVKAKSHRLKISVR